MNPGSDWLGQGNAPTARAKPASAYRYLNSSPEVIRLVLMMYVRFVLSLRNKEDLLFERGIDTYHETVCFRWKRFGPMFASVHANFQNHFDTQRHLVDRQTYKVARSVALAE